MNIVNVIKNKFVFYPPQNIATRDVLKPSIFLGGTIDMGNSVDWQEYTTELIIKNKGEKYNIFNPRRKDWDSSWEQKFENPQFYQQVMWEMGALEQSDIILIYFKAGSQSPISLLELGLYARSGKLSVVCEEGFWRKGNVDIVCNLHNVPMFETIGDWVISLDLS
jgi:hypothetical protein